MKSLLQRLWTEPVLILAILTGVVGVLGQQGIIAGWWVLIALAITTPIQRELVKPIRAVRKRG